MPHGAGDFDKRTGRLSFDTYLHARTLEVLLNKTFRVSFTCPLSRNELGICCEGKSPDFCKTVIFRAAWPPLRLIVTVIMTDKLQVVLTSSTYNCYFSNRYP